MASNLDTSICLGEYNACILRAARLGPDCHPLGGADSGIVTAGIVTATADPDVEDGQAFEPKTGCGLIAYAVKQEPRIKRYNVSGELIFFDWEAHALMFGGSTILGRVGGSFSGKVIGYADRLYNAAPQNGIYLEIIRQVASTDGDCPQTTGVATPAATGYILGKVKLIPGSQTFENDAAKVMFTGFAQNNNWLANGPWNDFPGTGYVPNSPLVRVHYSQAEYNAIAALAGCGYQTLPAGS